MDNTEKRVLERLLDELDRKDRINTESLVGVEGFRKQVEWLEEQYEIKCKDEIARWNKFLELLGKLYDDFVPETLIRYLEECAPSEVKVAPHVKTGD